MFCLNKPSICGSPAPFSWAVCSARMVWPAFPTEGLPGDTWGRDHCCAMPSPPLPPFPHRGGCAGTRPAAGPQPSPDGGRAQADSPTMTLSHLISLDEHFCASFLCARSSYTSPLLFLHLITSRDVILHPQQVCR